MKNAKELFDTAMAEVLMRKPSEFEITDVYFTGEYHHKVSNSHSAPRGETNKLARG